MKYCWIMNLAVLLIAGLIITGCEKDSNSESPNLLKTAKPVKILSVQSSQIHTIRSYPGTLDASQKAELAFRVGGELVELPGQPGMQLKKGELIARLDEAEYKNILDEREAKYELAKIQFNQARKLVNQKVGSKLQFDLTKAELKSAKSAMEMARDNLSYTKLVAPFDGIIAQLSVENYQAIQPQVPIIQFQNEASLDVYFSVPESIITQLINTEEDQDIIRNYCGKVRFGKHPDKQYKACYKKHESIPDPLTRNYSAVFSLQPIKEFSALPGMTVTMTLDFAPLLIKKKFKGVLVPVETVFDENGKQWVWRVNKEMKAKKTEVKTGRFIDDKLLITDGLQQGQLIIAAGVSYIREDMLVRAITKERGL